jgi:curli biogenesis system outer membrane secretion channel CsgG
MTIARLAAAAAFLLGSTAAFAQTPAPTAPAAAPAATAPAAPAQPAASDMTKDGKPRMKVVRAQCRDEVGGQKLTGDARKQAMADCIVKQRPDMEARIKCQMDPSLKGMDKGARHAAVQACVVKAKG